MHEAVRLVKDLAPNARLDCCPHPAAEDGTGYFIRIGSGGPWISLVRTTARAAWANAAARLRAKAVTAPQLTRRDVMG